MTLLASMTQDHLAHESNRFSFQPHYKHKVTTSLSNLFVYIPISGGAWRAIKGKVVQVYKGMSSKSLWGRHAPCACHLNVKIRGRGVLESIRLEIDGMNQVIISIQTHVLKDIVWSWRDGVTCKKWSMWAMRINLGLRSPFESTSSINCAIAIPNLEDSGV